MAAAVRECRARVIQVRQLTPDILEADFRLEDPPTLAFEAGQWVSVPFGPKTVRAYSIASVPEAPRTLTLAADVSPAGIGSAWFRSLRPGVEVGFKAPFGGFVFRRADPRRPLFVAEEIGIVPIRGILSELFQTGFGRPASLVYWTRDPGWLAYDRDFRSLSRRHPNFSYHPVVGTADAAWAGAQGDLVEAVARAINGIADLVAYVAGGGEAIKRVREVLVAKGLDRKSVRWERFW